MSDGVAGATPLEEQIDDLQAVIDGVGSEQPVLCSYPEGCGLTALYAASHPDLVRALVLLSPQPRLMAGPGYEWAPSVEERAAFVQTIVDSWGTPANPLAALVGGEDETARRRMARLERLAMRPTAAAASLAWSGETDVREVLPSVQCPTLVLRLADDAYLDGAWRALLQRHDSLVREEVERHRGRYVKSLGDGALAVLGG